MHSTPSGEVSSGRLRALPVQLMSTDAGVILARGVSEICIGGEKALEIVPAVLAAASGEPVTRPDLVERFAEPDREIVANLVDELVRRSILVPWDGSAAPEGIEPALDVFYWHFGQTARTTLDKINEKPIAILGVNCISRRIAQALRELGAERVEVVDFHILRNLRMFDSEGVLRPDEWPGARPIAYEEWGDAFENAELACLVATSDFGGPHLMREWNRFCVENGIHFLPVVLERFTGTIGPLVIPGETACYECLRIRENANMDAPEVERLPEEGAPSRQAVTGFHPAMANVLGELAAMELCKIHGGGMSWRANRLIEVNLMGPAIFPRRVLKLPLCPVCSPAVKTCAPYLDKDSFVPGNQLNFHQFR